jgi:hypothetical protein
VARLLPSALAAAFVATAPLGASAFSVLGKVFDDRGHLDVIETLRATDRWSVDPAGGLHDGVIDVAIDPALAWSLGIADADGKAAAEQAVVDGVLRWSSPVLAFDVSIAVPDGSHDIEITAAHDAEVRALGGGQGGIALVYSDWSDDRVLSDGSSIPGWSIESVEIVLNATTLQQLFGAGLPIDIAVKPLLRLTAHEVGHGLGFAHPTDDVTWNLDSDSDPLNRMVVDPTDPFASLMVSTNVDDTAVMVPAPDFPTLGVAFETRLKPDDRAARNVLYPERRNAPPVCTDAVANPARLWPPDRSMVPIRIEGVTDPDDDPVEARATDVRQDESVEDGASGPGADAQLAPLAVRAQRNGRGIVPGNGRVYHVSFSAKDGNGGACHGVVKVCVPHAPGSDCGDDGARHDSLD